jgi:hypothetical protein
MAEFVIRAEAGVFAELYASYLAAPEGRAKAKAADSLRAFVAATTDVVASEAGYRADCVVRVRLKPSDSRGVQHLEIGISTKPDAATGWENRTELVVALYPGIPGQITLKKYRVGSDPQMSRKNMLELIRRLAASLDWRYNP